MMKARMKARDLRVGSIARFVLHRDRPLAPSSSRCCASHLAPPVILHCSSSCTVIPGRSVRTEPGISRFRVRCCAPPRN